MSYKDFSRDLRKNAFHNVIVLYGKENFLMRWAVDQICNKYAGKKFRKENVMDLAGDEVEIPEIIGMASTPSMFGGQRVIVVRNLPLLIHSKKKKKKKEETEKIEEKEETTAEGEAIEETAEEKEEKPTKEEEKLLLEFAQGPKPKVDSDLKPIEDPKPLGYLVLVLDSQYSKEFTKNGKIDDKKTTAFIRKLLNAASSYDMDTLSRPDLVSFIGKRVKAAGKTMTSRQLNRLIDETGYFNKDSEYRLDDLANDLNKILTSGDGDNLEDDQIEDLVAGDEEKYVFDLMDALLSRDRKRAMTMTMQKLSTTQKLDSEAFPLIGLLTSQLEMMYDALTMEENGISMQAMIQELGVKPYRFQKAYKMARRYSMDRLKELLILLYNCDRDVKNGNLSAELGLETFLLHV